MDIKKILKFTRNYRGLFDERISTWLYHRFVKGKNYEGITWFDNEEVFLHYNSKEYIERRIWMTGEYEPEIWKVFKTYINTGDVVFDIGANIGVNSIRMSKLVGENGKVYSFEPFIINRNRYYKNILLNNIKNFELIPIALGNKQEQLNMFININEENLGSLSLRNNKPGENIVNVEIGDNWFLDNSLQRIDFMKIDVEGYEWKVIDGFKNTIKNYHPKILIEWDINYQLEIGLNFNEWQNFIMENEYKIYQINRYELKELTSIQKAMNGNLLLV